MTFNICCIIRFEKWEFTNFTFWCTVFDGIHFFLFYNFLVSLFRNVRIKSWFTFSYGYIRRKSCNIAQCSIGCSSRFFLIVRKIITEPLPNIKLQFFNVTNLFDVLYFASISLADALKINSTPQSFWNRYCIFNVCFCNYLHLSSVTILWSNVLI